ncbi:MAG: DEAD/DEAH box helicase [archaeon]
MIEGINPREYQQKIFETCSKKNCLVVLPTGMGKTLIALMLAVQRQKEVRQSKVLFLAPTKPLAEQHFKYFQKHLPQLYGQFELFTGKVNAAKRKELWKKSDVVFSTPQCIANDLKSERISLEDVSLLVEDEAHRCLKSYDYVYVVKKYREQGKNQRILGLTASPGSDKSVIQKICENLDIEAVEIRTRESGDVKEYLQELQTEVEKVDLPPDFVKIRDLMEEIFKRKAEELKNRKLLFAPPTKKNLLELQGSIMNSISSGNKHFNLLKGASVCAQAIKVQHALEMIETQGAEMFYDYVKGLFDQAAKGKSMAVKHLVKTTELNRAYMIASELKIRGIKHPKLEKLKEIISKSILQNPKLKAIIFSQYRNTALAICKELNGIGGINARVFLGQTMKDGKGLSQKEQQELIRDFGLGKVNMLVATSIGEEGLDIPEVNLVIFYEPIPSAIRRIQRIGRTARLMPGKVVILVTRKTRDEAYHYASIAKEKKMYGILNNMGKEFKDKDSIITLDDFAIKEEGEKSKNVF